MAITAAKLQVDVDANTKGFRRGIDDADGRVRTFGDKLKSGMGTVAKWGLVAAGAASAAAAAFGVKAVGAASDLNETLSKTEQVFGEAVGQVTSFADKMAESFGLPKTEILDAASNIGLVAKASGLSEAAAADMSTEMSQLAADASSFFNVPLPQALEKIRSGLVGEAEPLRSFGVLLSAAAVEEKAVAAGIAEAGEELTEQQKVMARAMLIQEGMTDASGDLARTQDSVANRTRELKGRFQNFTAEIGQRLLPVAEKVLSWAGDHMPAAMDAVSSFIDNRLIPTFNRISSWWEANGPTIMAAVAAVKDAIQAAFDIISDVVGTAVETVRGWFGRFEGTMSDNESRVAGFYTKIKGIIDQIAPLFRSAFDAVKAIVSTVLSIIQGFWDRFGRHIVDFAMRTFSRLLDFISGIFKALRGVFEVFAGLFTGDWSRMWQGVKDIFAGVWDAIKALLGQAIDTIKTILGGLIAAVSQIWSEVWERARGVIKSGVDSTVTFFRELPGRIVGALGDLGRLLYGAGRDLLRGFIDGIKSMISGVVNAVTGALGDAIDAAKRKLRLGSPSRVFAEMAEDTMAGWVKGMQHQRDRAAMETLRSLGVPEVRQSVSQTVTARSTAGAAPSRPQVIVIEMDRREMARTLGNTMMDEIRVHAR